MTRTLRDKNYEVTKDMSRQELMEWYKKRGEAAKTQFNKGSKDSQIAS